MGETDAIKPRIFEVSNSFIPISVLILLAPVIIMSIQAFYKVDRAAQDIVTITAQVERIKIDVNTLGYDSARTEAKLDMIVELVREVRENQKKGH